jgi:polysaccharide deacetylase 2 family uncharacterized protein YibQ
MASNDYQNMKKDRSIFINRKFRLSLILIYLAIIIVALFIALQTTNNKNKNNRANTKAEKANISTFYTQQEQFHSSLLAALASWSVNIVESNGNLSNAQDKHKIINIEIIYEDSSDIEQIVSIVSKQAAAIGGEVIQHNQGSKSADVVAILDIKLKGELSHQIFLINKKKEAVSLKRVAIIIDDLGYNLEMIHALVEINKPLTLSIIPHLKHSKATAQIAHSRGYEVMLHLPMEPENYPKYNPGAGALLIKMTPDEIYRTVIEDISSIPYIKGVNNHMGSRATQDYTMMREVLKIIKEQNLYFIDSQTSVHTVAYQVAKELGIPSAIRTFFIDEADEAPDVIYTERELKSLYEYALKNGYAIGIGHAYPATIQALKKVLPDFDDSKVKLVFASEIVS